PTTDVRKIPARIYRRTCVGIFEVEAEGSRTKRRISDDELALIQFHHPGYEVHVNAVAIGEHRACCRDGDVAGVGLGDSRDALSESRVPRLDHAQGATVRRLSRLLAGE